MCSFLGGFCLFLWCLLVDVFVVVFLFGCACFGCVGFGCGGCVWGGGLFWFCMVLFFRFFSGVFVFRGGGFFWVFFLLCSWDFVCVFCRLSCCFFVGCWVFLLCF